MVGMEVKFYLIVDELGIFKGFFVNYSGVGFIGMKFDVIVIVIEVDFDVWVNKVKNIGFVLIK